MSSTTTLDPLWSELDRVWLEALAYLERNEGPHGHPMWEALSPDADPNNPDAHYRYVAGTPIVDPDTGQLIMAASFDWVEKARLDYIDRMRGDEPDKLNGVIVPVHRTKRTPNAERPQSPLDRWKAKRRALSASTPNTEP